MPSPVEDGFTTAEVDAVAFTLHPSLYEIEQMTHVFSVTEPFGVSGLTEREIHRFVADSGVLWANLSRI